MQESTVTVIATIKVKPGLEERARQVLRDIVPPTLKEPGCLAYDLHQSASDPTEFLFHEKWVSDEALAAHAASTAAHRVALRSQLGDLLDGAPAVTRWRRVN
jgi:quinol monooxygenase YgiN